jgi:hypothetical protein
MLGRSSPELPQGDVLLRLQPAIALFTCGCLAAVASSPASIGFVVADGAMVDGSVVRGNATLFQGNVVRAGETASDLVLSSNSHLLLEPGAEARIYRDYGVLEHGSAIQHGTHSLVADGLKVNSLAETGAVLVEVQDASHLRVIAQSASAEVHRSNGVLVAKLEPGKSLGLTLQAAAPPPSQDAAHPAGAVPAGSQITIHGILRKDHPGRYGHYLLTDLTSKVTYELQGSGLDDLVGASVEATGSAFEATPAPGATQVLSVSDVHQMPLSEMQEKVPGLAPAQPPAPTPPANVPAEAPPAPAAEPATPPAVTPEAGANPEPTPTPEPATVPQPPPIAQSSNTAKILLIVGLAGGAVVGVALGLGGGKSSTVSPE